MFNRKISASAAAALLLAIGNAAAADNSPFPSAAREQSGHWTGLVGAASSPGNDPSVFPSAAMEFSGQGSGASTYPSTRGSVAVKRRGTPDNATSRFPSAGAGS